MEFEDGGGVAKVAPLAVEAERRKRRDGRGWGLGAGGWGLGAREDVGFEEREAVEAPGRVG
jgi:hypothetical protein